MNAYAHVTPTTPPVLILWVSADAHFPSSLPRDNQSEPSRLPYHRIQPLPPTWLQQPTLNTTGAVPVADHRPLHQRVWEVEREREHRLRLLVADKEKREGATFAPPPMGRVSERLADTRPAFAGEGGGGPCGEGGGRSATRLQEQAMWARERRRLRVQEHEEVHALFRELRVLERAIHRWG